MSFFQFKKPIQDPKQQQTKPKIPEAHNHSLTQHPQLSPSSTPISPSHIKQWQSTIGNQAVSQLLKSRQQIVQSAPKINDTHTKINHTQQPTNAISTAQINKPIQRALVKDQDILDKKGSRFNWEYFRGKRDDDNPLNPGQETGRGAKIGSGFTTATSSIKWDPVHSKAGEGTKMEAIIGPDHHLGSSPSEKNAKARVDAFKNFSGQDYKAGHLLNEKLGGSGKDRRNLTAISGSANSKEGENIENHIRKPVNEQGHWYKYIVEVDYKNDSAQYANSSDQIKNFKKITPQPTGIVLKKKKKKTKVEVCYASKLKAHWYQLNTDGNRYGPEYKKDIVIPSPLKGGKAGLDDKGGDDSPSSPGTAAITHIEPEELVLTSSEVLKAVVGNREGLIHLLEELRDDKEQLNQTIDDLNQLVEQTNYKLEDTLYDFGYKCGYDDGYAAFEDDVEYMYYEDNEQNGKYSKGYERGYENGYFEAKQYHIGLDHGWDDGYNELDGTGMSSYYDKFNKQTYRDGYDEGVGEGRYDLYYEKGEKDGYQAGFEDQGWFYNFNAKLSKEEGYRDGYDAGYDDGQHDSPYRAGKRPVFNHITMAAGIGAINVNALRTFWGETSVELTGNKYFNHSTAWYEVKILTSDDFTLSKSKGNTAWMKKKWLEKGK